MRLCCDWLVDFKRIGGDSTKYRSMSVVLFELIREPFEKKKKIDLIKFEVMNYFPKNLNVTSRWRHPLVFVAAAIGLAGSSGVYYANIRARQKARRLFIEQNFFEDALELTRAYKPIAEKLVLPIEPLQIDTMSRFNFFSPTAAQVRKFVEFFRFSLIDFESRSK